MYFQKAAALFIDSLINFGEGLKNEWPYECLNCRLLVSVLSIYLKILALYNASFNLCVRCSQMFKDPDKFRKC